MSHVVQHILEAGVRRRRHPRDYRGSGEGGGDFAMAPNVHNSLAIQKKHVANMYRTWRSLNSHAFGPLDTDQYARHIPVGRVCAERTSTAPLTETDLGNMYAGSFVFSPGPGTYGVGVHDSAAFGPDQQQRGWSGTMGSAARKCMTPGEGHPQLAHAKRREGGGPGPGAYATGDSAVMGHRGGTFAAQDERRGAASALETAVCRLKTLEWRIDFTRRGLREPQGLRPGQELLVKTQSGRELERIEAKASRLRSEVERLYGLATAAAAKRDPLPGASLGGCTNGRRGGGGSDRRPATTAEVGGARRGKRRACGQGNDRFYDPLPCTATFLESPGPGTYSVEGTFGRGSIRRSPSFDLMQRRVVGEHAAPGRSLASLHLHATVGGGGGRGGSGWVGGGDCGSEGGKSGDGYGAPFHAYMPDTGPGHYTPDMCAPPLPNEARTPPHPPERPLSSQRSTMNAPYASVYFDSFYRTPETGLKVPAPNTAPPANTTPAVAATVAPTPSPASAITVIKA
eukprot:g16675.t1